MTYLTVSFAYTGANLLLALIIYFKSSRHQLSWYYLFCVLCLTCFGVGATMLSMPNIQHFRNVIEQSILFIYSLYPFLFIHFITYFARRNEIIKSIGSNTAIYFVGLFSYALILLGYIPKPISPSGTILQAGYIFYITWMSIFFCIGIAMLFEITHRFRQKIKKANIVFISSLLLLLILPGPFTDSIIFGALKLNTEWYFYLCTFALIIAVYFIFRHKIIVTTMYEALKVALDVMNDIFITMDNDFHVEMVRGKSVLELMGYQEHQLVGRRFDEFIDQRNYLAEYRTYITQKKMKESYFDANLICKNSDKIPMNFSFTPVFEETEITGFVAVGRNITERKILEDQLRQSQKMESLGTLAGGIAHDFNNLLQIILLCTNSLKRRPLTDEDLARTISINVDAIDRGSKLIRQILTFARKTEVNFAPIQITNVIGEMKRLISETFPRNISLEIRVATDIPLVCADNNQIHQVLINLCVNARDAMERGGILAIKCDVVNGQDIKNAFPEANEKKYVCISVADNGVGMPDPIRERIFEPFYTTKELGKGTGLGLAVVYGIVLAHKGFIDVRSTPGLGTTFYVYLPVANGENKPYEEIEELSVQIAKGTETILLVEDEEPLLHSVSALLRRYGYKIIAATDGYKAIELYWKHRSNISLIIMDIGLPKKSGWEAYREIRAMDNQIKIIISSGYLDPKIKSEELMKTVNGFIPKPYESNKMLETIRKILDENMISN